MMRTFFFFLFFLSVARGARAAEGDAYIFRIESEAQFEAFSLPERFLPGVDRTTKFTVPATNKPDLLPPVFQNVNKYPFHQEFLAAEFPERFPGLTGREYLALVERRATREYFAGVFFRFPGEPDDSYGFDLFTLNGDRAELPRQEEVRWVHTLLKPVFALGTLAYAPRNPDAIDNAKLWPDIGLPINFTFSGESNEYIAYTIAQNYGRVRVFTQQEFTEANETGAFGSQDIVVLDVAPADIEGVIAGAITGSIQSELGHLAIRTAQRGTPNAYVRNATTAFGPHNGKLVFLDVGLDSYQVREATLPEAESWWAAHRPNLGGQIPEVAADYQNLDAVWEIPLDGAVRLVTRYGGKGSNFARLYPLLPKESQVPGFIVPFYYYLQFLETNRTGAPSDAAREVTYAQYIEELLADPAFRGDSRRRFQELERLRDIMEDDGRVDPQVVKAIALKVVTVFGTGQKRVRCRSSSNAEDILEFNGAGLYSSTSACAADDLDVGAGGPSRCDPAERNEQGLARGLKRVWASLWNFRGFEEREYFQIPQTKARMAVLVSEAFPDELANGVAFTGNPTVRGDRRFLVNAQLGDTPVVFTDPGVEAEKDILEMENGRVANIIRVRPSSLAPPGTFVLSDDNLREMGARMAEVEQKYTVELGKHKPDEVVLDFEWKLDRHTGHIRFKQVRPFLIVGGNTPPPREFRLQIPQGLTACASFLESRPVLEVLQLKARLGFRAGEQVVRSDGTSAADVFEWLQLSPGGPQVPPLGKGVWTADRTSNPTAGYNFSMSQDFRSEKGELVQVSLVRMFVPNTSPPEVVLNAQAFTWAINHYFMHVEFSFPEDPPDAHRTTWFLPCELDHLPLFKVDAQFVGGDRVHFEERFQDVLDGTGPAELVSARVNLGGVEQVVSDYWRLGYSAGHHNDTPRPEHWAVLDPPVDLAGVGRVKAVVVGQNYKGEEEYGFLLGEGFNELKPLEFILFRRQKEGDPEVPQFRRGDANSSAGVNITDVIGVLLYQFAGGSLACPDAADFDDIGTLDLDDAILLLHYLFFNLDAPAAPGPLRCGEDVAPDALPPCEGAGCR